MAYLDKQGNETDDIQNATDDDTIYFSASEVADNILNHGAAVFDMSAWPNIHSDVFANFYYDLMSEYAGTLGDDAAERNAQLADVLRWQIVHLAQQEIDRRGKKGLTK